MTEMQTEVARVETHDRLVHRLRELTWQTRKSDGYARDTTLPDVLRTLAELYENDGSMRAKDFDNFYGDLDDKVRTAIRRWIARH